MLRTNYYSSLRKNYPLASKLARLPLLRGRYVLASLAKGRWPKVGGVIYTLQAHRP